MRQLLIFLSILFLSSYVFVSSAAENFVQIRLPKGVSVELPRNWIVLNGSQKITLDSAVDSGLDLAGVEQENSILPFAANYYYGNGKTAAIVNIRFYPDLKLTQADALAATSQDVMELDGALREAISEGIKVTGGNISSWRGTEKNTIKGLTVFTTEYSRPSLRSLGNFRVRLVRALLAERSFTMTVSYLESQEPLLKLITDRIISSIEVAGIETLQIPKTNNVGNEKEWDSVMGTFYGENWGLGLVISAFITWGIGLTPPLLLRFAILRRPIGKWWAIGTVSILWMVSFLMVVALGSTSKTHTASILVAVVSYFILRKGVKQKLQETSN